MARPSPLVGAQANSVSVCGKILQSGQSIVVPESAIGPRERRAEEKGKITLRHTNTTGEVQICCTLGA